MTLETCETGKSTGRCSRRKALFFGLLGVLFSLLLGLFGFLFWSQSEPHTNLRSPTGYALHPSPNFDQRPEGEAIDTIVLHATERGALRQVVRIFASPRAKVSAHYTIGRRGRVVQHVEEQKRAWHAGVSRMPDGRESVNGFSIGIELVNRNDGYDRYRDAQVAALRELIADIRTRHEIKYIVTHAQVAQPPGRKSDPVGFQMGWIESATSLPK